MSSPITFSGFNNIDFSVVLTAMMTQASQPLTALQTHQANLRRQASTYDQLASKLSALNDAASALQSSDSLETFKATSGDTSAVAVSAGSGAVAGHYDVVVQELARAQVTATTTTAVDPSTTAVTAGGTITIDGVLVTVTGSATLQQVASAINGADGIGVTASVVRSAPGAYRLVLTSRTTGEDGAFTIANGLSAPGGGGSGVTFASTNAVDGTDAQLLVNNIAVTGSSNTFDDAIPGLTFTVFKKDPLATVGVEVASDTDALKTKVQTFVDAYNGFVKFASDQATSAAGGDESSIGRESLMRTLRNQLRSVVASVHGSGAFTHLAEVGVEFTQTGTIQLNSAVFDAAISSSPDDLKAFFTGTGGAFSAVTGLIDDYDASGGLVSSAKTRLTQQASALDSQIASMQNRLAIQRAALQAEFVAADNAMSALKAQSGSLSNIGASLSSF